MISNIPLRTAFSRIKSKYLALQIFSYAGFFHEVLPLLFGGSSKLRKLILDDNIFVLKIINQQLKSIALENNDT